MHFCRLSETPKSASYRSAMMGKLFMRSFDFQIIKSGTIVHHLIGESLKPTNQYGCVRIRYPHESALYPSNWRYRYSQLVGCTAF